MALTESLAWGFSPGSPRERRIGNWTEYSAVQLLGSLLMQTPIVGLGVLTTSTQKQTPRSRCPSGFAFGSSGQV